MNLNVYTKAVQKLKGSYTLHMERTGMRNKVCLYEKNHGRIPDLTHAQKEQTERYFAQYGIKMRGNYDCHRFFTAVNGYFSPLYIPNDLFRVRIEPALNQASFKKAWADKNIYDRLFPQIKFPHTIFHNIGGFYYDANYKPISRKEALCLVSDKYEFVIKKATESGGGKGILHVEQPIQIADILDQFGSNYIVQDVLKQHYILSKLNASSVNIVRIITLRLHNEVKVLSSTLRIGAPGSFTDNYIDDKGRSMLVISVNENGVLSDKAYYASGEARTDLENGEVFGGTVLPKHYEMTELAKELHKELPYFKMVGWDMTTDFDGSVVLMEYNINSIGIVYYQYTNGPLFGDATDDVLSYISRGGGYIYLTIELCIPGLRNSTFDAHTERVAI